MPSQKSLTVFCGGFLFFIRHSRPWNCNYVALTEQNVASNMG